MINKLFSILIILALIGNFVYGQVDSTKKTIDQYSIEELLSMTVYTAEKHKQSIEEVPASVVVITNRFFKAGSKKEESAQCTG